MKLKYRIVSWVLRNLFGFGYPKEKSKQGGERMIKYDALSKPLKCAVVGGFISLGFVAINLVMLAIIGIREVY